MMTESGKRSEAYVVSYCQLLCSVIILYDIMVPCNASIYSNNCFVVEETKLI